MTELEMQAYRASADYACIRGTCDQILQMRPGTQYFRVIQASTCASVLLTTTTPLPTTRATTTAANSGDDTVAFGTPSPPQDQNKWPHNWGVLQWLAVCGPAAVLICIGVYICCRMRRRKKSRVHVEAFTLEAGGTNATLLDFTEAGPLTTEQLRKAEGLLAQAALEAKKGGRPPPPRRLAIGAGNELRSIEFLALKDLLAKHPEVSLALHLDWRKSSEDGLEELCKMLKVRARCSFRHSPNASGQAHLRLPLNARPVILSRIGEALSGCDAQAVVDAVSLEPAESTLSTSSIGRPVVVPLGPLRLGPQELVLNRQHVGDGGCAVACGFVRPWAGRLIAARFLECEIGDDGAVEIARLLLGDASRASNSALSGAASSLRELVLSANRIGDRGIAKIAEALPKCDGLERLLVDRNLIGAKGATALAQRLPRSSIRELVLGSHLGGNLLGPTGVEALAGALIDELPRAAANRATRLEALSLEGCCCCERGAKAIAAALPKSALNVLSLARNELGDAGAAALLQALPSWMISLDLASNDLSDEVGALAGQVLYRMPALSLSLAQNELSPALKAVLRDAHGARLRV